MWYIIGTIAYIIIGVITGIIINEIDKSEFDYCFLVGMIWPGYWILFFIILFFKGLSDITRFLVRKIFKTED